MDIITTALIKQYCRVLRLKGNDVLFLDHIASFQNGGKRCWQSLDTIAEELFLSVSTVQRIMKRVGDCLKVRRTQSSNHYFLDFHMVKKMISDVQNDKQLNQIQNCISNSIKINITTLIKRVLADKKSPEYLILMRYATDQGYDADKASIRLTDFLKNCRDKHPEKYLNFRGWYSWYRNFIAYGKTCAL